MADPKPDPTEDAEPLPAADAEKRELEAEEEATKLGDFA